MCYGVLNSDEHDNCPPFSKCRGGPVTTTEETSDIIASNIAFDETTKTDELIVSNIAFTTVPSQHASTSPLV